MYGRADILGHGGGGAAAPSATTTTTTTRRTSPPASDDRVDQIYEPSAPRGAARGLKGSSLGTSSDRAWNRRRTRLNSIRQRNRADVLRRRRRERIGNVGDGGDSDSAPPAETAAGGDARADDAAGADDGGDDTTSYGGGGSSIHRELREQFLDTDFLTSMIDMLFYHGDGGGGDDDDSGASQQHGEDSAASTCRIRTAIAASAAAAAAALADEWDDCGSDDTDGAVREHVVIAETDAVEQRPASEIRLDALRWFRYVSCVPWGRRTIAGGGGDGGAGDGGGENLCERIATMSCVPPGATEPVEFIDHIAWLVATADDERVLCEAAWLGTNMCALSTHFATRFAFSCGDGSDEFDADGHLVRPTLPRRICDRLVHGGDEDEMAPHTRAMLTHLLSEIALSSHEARQWCIATGALDALHSLLRPPAQQFSTHRECPPPLYERSSPSPPPPSLEQAARLASGRDGDGDGDGDDDDYGFGGGGGGSSTAPVRDEDGGPDDAMLRHALERQAAQRSFGEASEPMVHMYREAVHLADALVCELLAHNDDKEEEAALPPTPTAWSDGRNGSNNGGVGIVVVAASDGQHRVAKHHRPDYDEVCEPVVCAIGELLGVHRGDTETTGIALALLTYEMRIGIDTPIVGLDEAAAAAQRDRTIEHVVRLSCVPVAAQSCEQDEDPQLVTTALGFLRAITEVAPEATIDYVFEQLNMRAVLASYPPQHVALLTCASLVCDFAARSADYARALVDDGAVAHMVHAASHSKPDVRREGAYALCQIFERCTDATLCAAIDWRATIRALTHVLANGAPHKPERAQRHENDAELALACCSAMQRLLDMSRTAGSAPVRSQLLSLFAEEGAIEILEQVRDGTDEYHARCAAEGAPGTSGDATVDMLARVNTVCDVMLTLYLCSAEQDESDGDGDGDDSHRYTDDDGEEHGAQPPQPYRALLRQHAAAPTAAPHSHGAINTMGAAAAAAAASAAAAAAGAAVAMASPAAAAAAAMPKSSARFAF